MDNNELRNRVFEIYHNEFNHEKYLEYSKQKLFRTISSLPWEVTERSILKKLKESHRKGFLGFHFIDGQWPVRVINNYLMSLYDGQNDNYILSRYCEPHDKMCIYINFRKLDILDKDRKYSYIENGNKYGDYCYEN